MPAPIYSQVREQIPSGALGLIRGENVITRTGRGRHRHAFTCAWRYGDQATLLAAEARELIGSRIVTVSSIVNDFPGLVDIFVPVEACPVRLRERAATIAINWAGRSYNYPGVLKCWMAHRSELVRLATWLGFEFNLDDTTPSPWDAAKHCSQFHAWSYRRAARECLPALSPPVWDPCPNLGDPFIEPSDLARSGAYTCLFKGLRP